MRTNKHTFRIAALSTVFTLGVGLIIITNKPYQEADAYSATSPTTTIDLNDCSESEIRNYYSSLNSFNASERQGTNLLKNLKTILKNGQQYLNYDSGSSIWELYEITDRDWVKSPASSISHGTYNSSTNKITGYVYGSSGDNPYIHALYVNRDVNNQTRAWGDHTQNNWGINREHIWAKSHGFQSKGAGGARGDPMHLWAGNGHANNIHGNNFFAFVDKSQSYTNCGNTYSFLKGNLSGQPLNAVNNSNKDVFEPQDCDKGDIARAVFYMVARYNNYAGNDNSIDTNNPNLVLANNMSENDTTGTSTASKPFAMGLLSDLLAWNKLDPVDEYEIHRNNLLYRNFTKNRNPFIDFPNWADAIWGTADLDGRNYNSTVTTYAAPTTDPISTSTVSQTFGISASSLTMEVDDTADILARNANSNITWTVADNTVASINKPTTENNETVTITALSVGTTTITATSGSDSATCTITVEESGGGGGQEDPSVLFTADLTDTASVNNGFSITTGFVSKKAGFYQDGGVVDSSINYFKVLRNTPLFTSQPSAITFTARLGSGSNKNPLSHNVEACLVDSDGNEIAATKRTVTTSITSSPNDYEIELPYNANAYGAKIMHMKADSHNIRYYSFSLSYEGNVPVTPQPTDYLGNVTRVAGLYGEETTTQVTGSVIDTINVSTLGIENGTAVTNVDLGCSVFLDGDKGTGSNVPKYYSSDLSIRVYNGGYITFESESEITGITFTVLNGYAGDVSASTGSFNGTTWSGSATSVSFTNNSSTQFRFTHVAITHEGVGSGISISQLAFKFGATIPQDDWDTIADNWEISDYGVMIVKENTLVNTYHKDTVAEAHAANLRLQDIHKGDGDIPYTSESDYLFTVKLNIGDNIAHDLRFCASPYIVVDDVYYFLGEVRYNVNQLAAECLTSGVTNLSSNALTYLTTH